MWHDWLWFVTHYTSQNEMPCCLPWIPRLHSCFYLKYFKSSIYQAFCCRNLTPWLESEGSSWAVDRSRESPWPGLWFATPRSSCWMRPPQRWTRRVKPRFRRPWIRWVDPPPLKDQPTETLLKFSSVLCEPRLKNMNTRADEARPWGFCF